MLITAEYYTIKVTVAYLDEYSIERYRYYTVPKGTHMTLQFEKGELMTLEYEDE